MIDEQTMIGFITEQRWFASKTREVIHAHVVDRVPLQSELELQLIEIGFETGTHDTYQLLSNDGIDALDDPRHARELVHMMRSGRKLPGDEGIVEFATVEGSAVVGHELREARLVGTEQTNSSVVFDDQLILKVFRRLEGGINPELEMLRALTERGFENIAQLAGWYAYSGRPMDATLGILQRFVVDGADGWELMLDLVVDDSDLTLERLRRLGAVTAEMHSVLGSDRDDPAFSPEETSAEALGLLIARVDEEIEAMFFDLPEDETVADIRGRGEDLRERLSILAAIGDVGRVIRTHGDFHLGQTLWSKGDWVLIDFEGEPARTLPERRRKRSPLRDVAGMLRSFAYVASALPMLRGVDVPDGWEHDAREAFLDGYRAAIEPTLVPSGTAFDRLLSVFELEKAVYELRYELNNRPGWSHIPVAGIVRMLGEELPA